jgi:hypothetical protein
VLDALLPLLSLRTLSSLGLDPLDSLVLDALDSELELLGLDSLLELSLDNP